MNVYGFEVECFAVAGSFNHAHDRDVNVKFVSLCFSRSLREAVFEPLTFLLPFSMYQVEVGFERVAHGLHFHFSCRGSSFPGVA